jgi:hypothetical protein
VILRSVMIAYCIQVMIMPATLSFLVSLYLDLSSTLRIKDIIPYAYYAYILGVSVTLTSTSFVLAVLQQLLWFEIKSARSRFDFKVRI